MSTQSLIDLPTFEALRESVGSDFLPELLQAYFTETPHLLANLQQALTGQDCDAFRLAAHSIKSTSNSFGALQFGALAKDLEMMAREGNLQYAPDLVRTLIGSYAAVKQALQELSHGE
jgi:histidine phosphotransfer protein HptB